MNATINNCKFCLNQIPAAAKVCPVCSFPQKFLLFQSLGKSIPLIASTASTLVLISALIWPLVHPERAQIITDTASPAYALNELRMDIANLSDISVLLPSEMYCMFRGDEAYLMPSFNEVVVEPNGKAYSILVLTRSPDSAVGLRNQSARIRYAVSANETWGAPGTQGKMTCDLGLSDVHGDLPPVTRDVAFEINDGGIILYDIGNYRDPDKMEINPGTFFGPRNKLLPSPD